MASTVTLNTSQVLRGRDGVVSRGMAAAAPRVRESVRAVARERLATSSPGGYVDQLDATWDGSSINVESNKGTGVVLERGSRPHEITGLMSFRVGGVTVFARRVNHPGTRPYNILMDGVRRAGREVF